MNGLSPVSLSRSHLRREASLDPVPGPVFPGETF